MKCFSNPSTFNIPCWVFDIQFLQPACRHSLEQPYARKTVLGIISTKKAVLKMNSTLLLILES